MALKSYHVNATMLPEAREIVDLWIVDGRFTFNPVHDAIDLPGAFMAPGLVDGHVHLSIDFANTGLPPASAELVLHNAQRHLQTGVTVLRDAGYVQQLNLTDVALPPIPIILQSGWIHVPEGRFFPGIDISKATSPDQLLSRFEEVAAYGCKWFKVIADFPGADMNLFGAPLTYPVEILRKVVEAAHGAGVRVLAHSTGPDVGAIVETGVDSIEHGMSITPDIVRRMAALGTQWCPTIATAEGFLKNAEAKGMSNAARLAYSARTTQSLEVAMALGVDVVPGSDELPHGTLYLEIDAMVRHGMSVDQALTAATIVGRRALGLRGIEEGAPADLVLWTEDPRLDLTRVSQPAIVLGNGVPVDLTATDIGPGVAQSVRQRHGDKSLEQLLGDDTCVFAGAGGHKHD
jgi:imidazolonepropionase-like amidohydrolase